ncbi:MAG: SDR family oxidoreductase [Candidatus Sumerlaeia bacterium]|nr:SDR family oxidoreductase [Candidatus Sumerlaeia bacterium]
MTAKTPRLLVTGASGFVGEVVARHFVALGWDVIALGGTRLPAIEGSRSRTLDLLDFPKVTELFAQEKPDFVFHGAGATSIGACQNNPSATEALNVGVTRHLLHLTTGRLLFCSTDLVFEGTEAPYDEKSTPKPLHEYGSQKLTAELDVLGTPRGVVIRLPLVLGQPGKWGSSALTWMVDALKQQKPVNLFHDEWRSPVWVEDVARACEVIFTTAKDTVPQPAIYHAAGADRLNRVEMGEMACRAFGLDASLIRPLSRLDVPGGEQRARDVSLKNNQLAALGWKPTPMDEAMTRCAAIWPAPTTRK